jgi:hypothetical protein
MPRQTNPELRRLIDTCPPIHGSASAYDPVIIIRIVNHLHPLGKRDALDFLSRYRKISGRSDHELSGLCFVLRTLFDVPSPPGYMPPLVLGSTTPPCPKDRKLCPRYPLLLYKDIPLLILTSITVAGGMPPIFRDDLLYFRKSGRFRDSLLVPPNDPVRLLGDLKDSHQWIFSKRFYPDLSRERIEREARHVEQAVSGQLSLVAQMQ